MAKKKRAPLPFRTGVTSACLRNIEHDEGRKRLTVEFKKSGAVYAYRGVSRRVATNLANAGSVGRHFVRNVRNNYAYEKLRAGRRRTKAKRTR